LISQIEQGNLELTTKGGSKVLVNVRHWATPLGSIVIFAQVTEGQEDFLSETIHLINAVSRAFRKLPHADSVMWFAGPFPSGRFLRLRVQGKSVVPENFPTELLAEMLQMPVEFLLNKPQRPVKRETTPSQA
jgi:hypothetical protein